MNQEERIAATYAHGRGACGCLIAWGLVAVLVVIRAAFPSFWWRLTT